MKKITEKYFCTVLVDKKILIKVPAVCISAEGLFLVGSDLCIACHCTGVGSDLPGDLCCFVFFF